MKLIVVGRDTQAGAGIANASIRFNNDSGANYDYSQVYTGGTIASGAKGAGGATSAAFGGLPGPLSQRSTSRGQIELLIPNYTDTAFDKSGVASSGSPQDGSNNIYSIQLYLSWNNTAAITRIDLLATDKFKAGSIFTLYGIT